MRFLTVTLNPAFDRLAFSDGSLPIMPDATVRTDTTVIRAGGKGINSARELTALGEDCIAIALCGNADADCFSKMLSADGIDHSLVYFSGNIRNNTTLRFSNGQFELNEAGAYIEDPEAVTEEIISKLDVSAGDCVIIGGSLPRGELHNVYPKIISAAKSRGAFVCLDTSGKALENAVFGDILPDLIKPNRSELEALIGKTASIEENIDLVKRFSEKTDTIILETLGKDGAIFAHNGNVTHVKARPVNCGDIVDMKGAGDVYLAAFLHGYLNICKYDAEASMRLAADEAAKHLTKKS